VFARVTNVSVTETDVLVHVITSEGDDIRTTMFHPFYVKDLEEDGDSIWVVASNLIKGQELLTEDGKIVYVEEVKIERLVESVSVYNLEIEELHTYYVDGGILVHNMCVVNKDDDRTANEIISQDKKASIRNMFPKELLDKTLKEIEDLAKKGNRIAKTAKKLLTDNDFNKASNSSRSKKGK